MHKFPEYTYASYDKEATPKKRRSRLFGASLIGFVSLGFLLGLGLLVARNWYLFS